MSCGPWVGESSEGGIFSNAVDVGSQNIIDIKKTTWANKGNERKHRAIRGRRVPVGPRLTPAGLDDIPLEL